MSDRPAGKGLETPQSLSDATAPRSEPSLQKEFEELKEAKHVQGDGSPTVEPSGNVARETLRAEDAAQSVQAAKLALKKAAEHEGHETPVRVAERSGLRAARIEAQFSGPLPPPSMLAQYDDVVPGLAAQLARALESEGTHRRGLEMKQAALAEREVALAEKAVEEDFSLQRLGMWLGFFICTLGFVAAVTLGLHGREVAAAVIGALDIVGVAAVFVTGARKDKKPVVEVGGPEEHE